MTVSEVITAFGAYYKNEGQGIKDIHKQLMQGFVSHTAFTHITTADTIWRASNALHARVVQPFQVGFTPTGSATFKPREIKLYNLKADLLETPDSIKESWHGFLASDNVKRTEWPFVKYWMEKMVIPQIQQDVELNEIGRGVYSAPTPGVAGSVGTSMDGILTVIQDFIDDGDITPITLGEVPTDADDFVTYMEDFHAAIPILYRHVPMNVYVPQDYVLRYKRGFRAKYGTNAGFSEGDFNNSSVKILDTNLTLVGLPSLNLKADGSPNDRFYCTPKANAILVTRGLGNMAKFDVQPFDRQVKLLTDWWMGVGFIDPGIVWVNDGAEVEEETPPVGGGGGGGGEGGGSGGGGGE